MNITDKLYKEWAWRSKTGTPSFDNPEDVKLLNEIMSNLGVVTEENNTEGEIIDKQDIIDYIAKVDLDDAQIKKLYNRVRNFTNYRAVKDTVVQKGFHSKIQKQYSKEIQELLEDLPDNDNKKLVAYLQDTSKQIDFPKRAHEGNIFNTISKTGVPNSVVTALARHTAQDEGKKGVGMGEIALAFLFKNVDSAGKGDLTLDGGEFEIKGYGARLGNTKGEQGSYIRKELGQEFEPYMDAVGGKRGKDGGFCVALANYIKENPDKKKDATDTMLKALRDAHGASAVNPFWNDINWTDAESINHHLQLMHFVQYAQKEGFAYFLAHDFGANSKDIGDYVMVGGDPVNMAKQLLPYMKNGKVQFERIRSNQLGPRIQVK